MLFQLHRRIPLVRRPFFQKDQARRERDAALSERDAAIAERGEALAERDAAIAERQVARRGVTNFHFVDGYERTVSDLIANYPMDEAMSLAVGGDYDLIGQIERDLLCWTGLANGMSIVDLGCGSGRLAHALGNAFEIDYLGIDIVQALLDYAATKSPLSYRFVLNRSSTLPADDKSADFVTAFSVFTHLLPSESYLYLEDARRVLKAGGKLVFSFLEVAEPAHWPAFEGEVNRCRAGATAPLNMMLERPMIMRMAETLGYSEPIFIGGREAPWGGHPLGQSVAVLSLSSDRP